MRNESSVSYGTVVYISVEWYSDICCESAKDVDNPEPYFVLFRSPRGAPVRFHIQPFFYQSIGACSFDHISSRGSLINNVLEIERDLFLYQFNVCV